MIYFLEDVETNVVLFLNNDRYLTTNIADGLLDVFVKMFPRSDQSVMEITKHLNQFNYETGLRVEHNRPLATVSLQNFPHVVDKFNLIQIRKPAFERLLSQYQIATAKNNNGFGPADHQAISYAVSNKTIIYDYAKILNMPEEFAVNELSMLNDSILSEQFRIYTLCSYWKDKINKATTKEQIDGIITRIDKSFVRQGGIDD